jgi:hypothetical protein
VRPEPWGGAEGRSAVGGAAASEASARGRNAIARRYGLRPPRIGRPRRHERGGGAVTATAKGPRGLLGKERRGQGAECEVSFRKGKERRGRGAESEVAFREGKERGGQGAEPEVSFREGKERGGQGAEPEVSFREGKERGGQGAEPEVAFPSRGRPGIRAASRPLSSLSQTETRPSSEARTATAPLRPDRRVTPRRASSVMTARRQ